MPYLSLFFPFSSFFLPFIPPLPLFLLCTLQLVVWARNALIAFSQRAPISASLQENGARWPWRGVGIFLKLLSHTAIMHPHPSSSPLFTHKAQLPPRIPLCDWWKTVGWDVRTCEWGQKHRYGIITPVVTWQANAGRVGQISAALRLKTLWVKSNQTGQTGTAANTWSYLEEDQKIAQPL